MALGELVKTGDWKGEKHVPVIAAPEKVVSGEVFEVKLCVGKEIAHPNTPAHYIKWIKLFFVPEGGKTPVEIANLTFDAHADTADAAKPGPVITEPFGSVKLKLTAGGTLIAQSYCNIHGLWENSQTITVG
ncbi:MAG: class II SORL domain-containing protein [Synergistaceae bacterium]|jgi:superoxide reductase|nr:class II SORL domain-containing protein [Synergistaceae bacterium]